MLKNKYSFQFIIVFKNTGILIKRNKEQFLSNARSWKTSNNIGVPFCNSVDKHFGLLS
jgi:hypothetical protein